ncbi:MAG: adenosylmethionine decarboxylase [Beijerinckiaceae bacterium]|jgi:S-adenosylmethionine decarboxylase
MNRDALFQSGMDLELPSTTRKEDTSYIGSFVSDDDRKDHLVVKNGVRYAGTHLIVELYEATHLDDIGRIDKALRACVKAAGATLLHIHLHHFEPNGGVSGVAVLAESHISIHSWPECGYAALDVFMCGETSPEKCVPVLKKAFGAKRVEVETLLRGKGI